MTKIPADPFAEWHTQLSNQRSRIRALGALDAGAFNWRPEEGKWSVGENLEHLSLTLGPYLAEMERASEEARASGRMGDGPWKRGWFLSWFIDSLEPPVKRRFRTFGSLVPPRELERDQVVEQLLRLSGDFGAVIDGMRGVDLGRVKFRSPLLALLKLDLTSGVELNLAHNRRHLWACDQITGNASFPGA